MRALLLVGAVLGGVLMPLAAPVGVRAAVVTQTDLALPPGELADSMIAADVTGDGQLDVVVGTGVTASAAGRLLLFVGDGRGGLTRGAELQLGAPVLWLAAADLTGDGVADTAITTGSLGAAGEVAVVSYSAAIPRVTSTVTVGSTRSWVDALDLDGDGDADLLTDRFVDSPGAPDAFRSDGRSHFGAIRLTWPSDVDCRPGAGEFNGDGKPDLVALTSRGVSVLLGRGRNRFGPGLALPGVPRAVGIYDDCLFATGDFDRDGHTDVLSTSVVGVGSPWFVSVSFGDGEGHFTPRRLLWADSDHFLGDMMVADVSGDGRPDAVTSSFNTGFRRSRHALGWISPDGRGGLAARTDIWFAAGPGADGETRLQTGDVDGDGIDDLVALDGARGPLVLITGAADRPLLGPVHAPLRARAGARVLVTLELAQAGVITIKLQDNELTITRLTRLLLPSGRHRVALRIPRMGRHGPRAERYQLWVHASQGTVTMTRRLALEIR